ncbi:MerR family transcriptional regulator [Streptomyces sp. NPDC048332]|uniref:MerR family transcriptional regulator n=1 Tax=unclassified Streptomyces TaxID=2593676 RepID=UPI003440548F
MFRTSGGHRHDAAEALTTVARIRALPAAGLPTETIRDPMPCFIGDGPVLGTCVQEHLQNQLHDPDRRMAGLEDARASLSDFIDSSTRAAASPPA